MENGMIKRIDSLGRIVIPKEIRKSMGAAAGTPMVISSTKEGVLLRKYIPEMDLLERLQDFEHALEEACGEFHIQEIGEMKQHMEKIKSILGSEMQ